MDRLTSDNIAAPNGLARFARGVAATLSLLALAACSSGGDSGNGGANTPPTVNAGSDMTVSELTAVNLMGSGSDANGDPLTYAWSQTAGSAVTLNNPSSAQANFMAPDVAAATPEVLTFQLTVSDGTANSTDSVNITVQEGAVSVNVSGTVNYEFVPPNTSCQGLDFDNTEVRFIRGATVQLLDVTDPVNPVVLDSTASDAAGGYAFADIPANTMVRLRVRAELKRTGTPRWDVEVRDNVDTSGSPPALGSRPLYVVEGNDFDTGAADVVEDMTAQSGWGVNSYTGPRAAAPFAILDSIYSAVQFVLSADPNAVFAPLDAFWSVNNTLMSPTDIDAGELGASFYRGDIDSLFLLGDANVDTEEFDDHVIVHEWGHYFEDNFSRSDSTGGAHSIGDRLDPRLAFGEGWATALSGMALGNPLYCDTGVPGTFSGFGIGTESGSYDAQGWYDEISVVRFIYDLWDDNDEGGDSVAIGFGPIYDVMTDEQAATDSFTSVFSFATALRASLNSGDQAGLDAQLAREDMAGGLGLDIWGSNEPNDAGFPADVLPVYTEIPLTGATRQVCTSDRFDGRLDGNKLGQNRMLRFDVPSTGRYDVTIITTTVLADDPADPNDQSDPDIFIYRQGQFVDVGGSAAENEEIFRTTSLIGPATYVATLREYRFIDEATPAAFPTQVCFDVSMVPAP